MRLVGLSLSRMYEPDSLFRGEGSWCGSPRRPEQGARVWVPPAARGQRCVLRRVLIPGAGGGEPMRREPASMGAWRPSDFGGYAIY